MWLKFLLLRKADELFSEWGQDHGTWCVLDVVVESVKHHRPSAAQEAAEGRTTPNNGWNGVN
jgi:hypothetical protein